MEGSDQTPCLWSSCSLPLSSSFRLSFSFFFSFIFTFLETGKVKTPPPPNGHARILVNAEIYGRSLRQSRTEWYGLHEMTKGYMDVRACIEQGQDGERKYSCPFFINYKLNLCPFFINCPRQHIQCRNAVTRLYVCHVRRKNFSEGLHCMLTIFTERE